MPYPQKPVPEKQRAAARSNAAHSIGLCTPEGNAPIARGMNYQTDPFWEPNRTKRNYLRPLAPDPIPPHDRILRPPRAQLGPAGSRTLGQVPAQTTIRAMPQLENADNAVIMDALSERDT